jgi:hypothetical protein
MTKEEDQADGNNRASATEEHAADTGVMCKRAEVGLLLSDAIVPEPTEKGLYREGT